MITCPILGMNKMSEKVRMDTLKRNKCRNKEGGKKRAGRSDDIHLFLYFCTFLSSRKSPAAGGDLQSKRFISGRESFCFRRVQFYKDTDTRTKENVDCVWSHL